MAKQPDPISNELEGTVQRVHSHYKDSQKHLGDWLTEARTLYKYVAGDQYDLDDRAIMEDENRPVIVFNFMDKFIDIVVGMEISNRQEIRYYPRGKEDVKVDEVMTGAGKWVRDLADSEDEETDAFRDTMVCGMGWTDTYMNYSENPDGEIENGQRLDPMRCRYDPKANKKNITDSQWRMYIEDWSWGEIKEDWPEVAEKFNGARGPWDNDLDTASERRHLADEAWRYERNGLPTRNQHVVRVAKYQWREKGTIYRVAIPNPQTGQSKMKEYKPDEWRKEKPILQELFSALGMPFVEGQQYLKQRRLFYKQAFVMGGTLLEEGEAPCDEAFTLQCITGKRDRDKNYWYGMGRGLKDPGKWVNKFFSSILDVIAKNAKGGMMIEEGAVADMRKFEDEWAKSDSVTQLEPGAISENKIKEKPVANYPEGLDRLLQFTMGAFSEVTGLNAEIMGMANRDQPIGIETQRKKAGMVILSWAFDALRRYRKQQGRVLAFFIRKYISDERLIRIVGQDGAQYVPLIKDPEVDKYDVVVDESPTSPNMKEQTWGVFNTMFPFLIQAGYPIPPSVLDYAPIPSGLAEEWKKLLQEKASPQVPPEVQEMQKRLAQLEESQKEADVAETRSKSQLNEAKTQEAAQKTGVAATEIGKNLAAVEG